MSDFKYAIANISLPLKLFPDGKYETLMDNIQISFTSADTLPEPNTDEVNSDYQAIVESIFPKDVSTKDVSTKDVSTKDVSTKDVSTKDVSTKDVSTVLTVLASEIMPKSKPKLNTTFKRFPGKSRQYTIKNNANPTNLEYDDDDSISSDTDADSP